MAIVVLKRYKVPSASEPGEHRFVAWRTDGWWCDCPAMVKGDCRHIRIVKAHLGHVMGHHNECWYTHDNRRLDEHHLMRASDRKHSISVYLTRWVHQIATDDINFDRHLQELFFNSMGKKTNRKPVEFEANLKEVAVRNLVSGDKGVTVSIETEEVASAMLLAEAEPEELIRLFAPSISMEIWGSITSVKKDNKQEEAGLAKVRLQCAPAEVFNASEFAKLAHAETIRVSYTPR